MYKQTMLVATLRKRENQILILLLFVTIIYQFFTMQIIEDMGDQKFYWQAARNLYLQAETYSFSHWSTRFGLIFPVYINMLIFGDSPVFYYVIPFIFCIIQTLFLYKLVCRISHYLAAIPVVLMILFLPQMVRNSSHLLPGLFSSTYIIIASYYCMRFSEKGSHRYLFMLISALAMFFAYETKVTNLFFLPGFGLAYWIARKRFTDALFFGSILLILFFIESSAYYIWTGDFMKRAHVIISSHINENNRLSTVSFLELFDRYKMLHPKILMKIINVIYLLGTLYLLLTKNSKQFRMLSLIPFSFYFFLTFAVRSIFPFQQLINNQVRYLMAAQALLFAVFSIFLFEILRNSIYRYKPLLSYILSASMISGILISFVLRVNNEQGISIRENLYNHVVKQTDHYNNIFDKSFKDSVPIVYTDYPSNTNNESFSKQRFVPLKNLYFLEVMLYDYFGDKLETVTKNIGNTKLLCIVPRGGMWLN